MGDITDSMNKFPPSETFARCDKEIENALWLQDGDPRQNSKAAKVAWTQLKCTMQSIPARSPDLNPIENFFHVIRKKLKDDAIAREIKSEKYEEFCDRVSATIQSEEFVEYISKTIESLPKRIAEVIKRRGGRTKY